jgi:ABC-type dipeptide/oligopeptide/nickel transport system permease subunit
LAALILSAVLSPKIGRSIWPPIIALVAFGWIGYSRIIRGDILSIKERDYVMAARVIGVKDSRILFRHIVPNAIFPTLVLASLAIGDVVLSFAALSFLGIVLRWVTQTGARCSRLPQLDHRIGTYCTSWFGRVSHSSSSSWDGTW